MDGEDRQTDIPLQRQAFRRVSFCTGRITAIRSVDSCIWSRKSKKKAQLRFIKLKHKLSNSNSKKRSKCVKLVII